MFRQLVLREQSDVSWPWFSHGINISNERSQRWVAHWHLTDSPPFIERDHIDKGPWVEGELLGERLLADGTIIGSFPSRNEPGLLEAGLIEEAYCADIEARRVVYDRARAHFVTFCERGLWLYGVGDPEPLLRNTEDDVLAEFLSGDSWGGDSRLALSRDNRYLAIWRHDDLPGYLGGKDPTKFQEVLLVDINNGDTTRVRHDVPQWGRIIDVEVAGAGELSTLMCSWDGKAGWKLALVEADGAVRPLETPARITGCLSNDRVVWLPAHGLVLFVWHPNLDGHVTIDVNQYTSRQQARTEWFLR